jgi:hypothetical protein
MSAIVSRRQATYGHILLVLQNKCKYIWVLSYDAASHASLSTTEGSVYTTCHQEYLALSSDKTRVMAHSMVTNLTLMWTRRKSMGLINEYIKLVYPYYKNAVGSVKMHGHNDALIKKKLFSM